MIPKIYLASDHGGFKLKKKIALFLAKKKFDVTDMGPFKLDMNDDYPDFVIPLAKQVVKSRGSFGVVFCRNGQGVCIATNKVKGIRSVTGFSVKEAKTTRKDDNANILCIPANYLTETQTKKIILTWLQTPFSNASRHKRRLNKIKKIEKS